MSKTFVSWPEQARTVFDIQQFLNEEVFEPDVGTPPGSTVFYDSTPAKAKSHDIKCSGICCMTVVHEKDLLMSRYAKKFIDWWGLTLCALPSPREVQNHPIF